MHVKLWVKVRIRVSGSVSSVRKALKIMGVPSSFQLGTSPGVLVRGLSVND